MSENNSTNSSSGFKLLLITLLSTAVFAGAGYGASYLMKEQWTSDVSLEKPSTAELGNYYSLFSTYNLVNEKKVDTEADMVVFNSFKQLATSYDHAKTFWENTDYYKQQLTDNPQHDSELLDKLIKKINLVENGSDKARLTLELENPKRANELLSSYMDYTNNLNKQSVYNDLIVKWKSLFDQVKSASEVNLDSNGKQNWEAKLKMMRSVSGLDDNLSSYHFLKKPGQAALSGPDRLLWAGAGAGVGFILGLLISLFIRRK